MELKVQDEEAVALAGRLVADAGQVAVKPVVGLTTEMREIVPAKFWMLVSDTDTETPAAPELKLTGVPALMVKSPTCTTELTEWDAVPGEPVPVTVTR